jgi:hypothetical protein
MFLQLDKKIMFTHVWLEIFVDFAIFANKISIDILYDLLIPIDVRFPLVACVSMARSSTNHVDW